MSTNKSEPTPKGCPTCVRRRIRCDLGRPVCTKCVKRGLNCPGYGKQLRWADGVAVRGKFKGQRVPVAKTEDDGKGRAATTLQLQRREAEVSLAPNFINLALFASSSPDIIDYYDKNLAGRMVWLDSEENDYRRRVVPLAANTPGLQFAIAAFSLYHGPLTFPVEISRFHEAARDACLAVIERQLHDMNSRLTEGAELNSPSDVSNAECILACILMVANYERAKHQAIAADGHRRAARKLVNVFGSKEGCKRGLFAFLRNQLSIDDVLASTTSFDLQDVEETIVPTPDSDHVLFAEFLSSLHEVTLFSRRAAVPLETTGSQILSPIFTAARIRAKFEQARGQTLMVAGQLRMEPAIVRREFIRLVDIYHHAALLYSYRCLGYATMANLDWIASTDKLFEQLDGLENIAICAHNLAWPIFIAGTECFDNVERQCKVMVHLNTVTEITGFKYLSGIGTFLSVFWGGREPDWRPVAQQLQVTGFSIPVA